MDEKYIKTIEEDIKQKYTNLLTFCNDYFNETEKTIRYLKDIFVTKVNPLQKKIKEDFKIDLKFKLGGKYYSKAKIEVELNKARLLGVDITDIKLQPRKLSGDEEEVEENDMSCPDMILDIDRINKSRHERDFDRSLDGLMTMSNDQMIKVLSESRKYSSGRRGQEISNLSLKIINYYKKKIEEEKIIIKTIKDDTVNLKEKLKEYDGSGDIEQVKKLSDYNTTKKENISKIENSLSTKSGVVTVDDIHLFFKLSVLYYRKELIQGKIKKRDGLLNDKKELEEALKPLHPRFEGRSGNPVSREIIGILKSFGLEKRLRIISKVCGLGKFEYIQFKLLSDNPEILDSKVKQMKFSSLETISFKAAIKEIVSRGKIREETKKKEAEKKEGQKKEEEKKKEEKKKDKIKRKESEKRADKIKDELKTDIEQSKESDEEKKKKLEKIEELKKINEEKEKKEAEKQSETENKIRELEQSNKINEQRIEKLTSDKKITVKTINQSLNELRSYKEGFNELIDKKRRMLITAIEHMKKKKDLQDKEYTDLVLRTEKEKLLLSEIVKEEAIIRKDKQELNEQVRRVKEKEKLFLVEKERYMNRNKILEKRLEKQKKRTHKRNSSDSFSKSPPIIYVPKEKDKSRQKKPTKKKTSTRKKRSNSESFIESLTPKFLKSQ